MMLEEEIPGPLSGSCSALLVPTWPAPALPAGLAEVPGGLPAGGAAGAAVPQRAGRLHRVRRPRLWRGENYCNMTRPPFDQTTLGGAKETHFEPPKTALF